MGTGTLTNRSAGQTILDNFFNDIHGALDGDFVGRNGSGVATSGQNLGTPAYPWGTARVNSLIVGGASVDTSQVAAPAFRVVSGQLRTTSNQPAYIKPNGAALSLQVIGTATNLVVSISGAAVTIAADITKSSLTAAASSNNTCLINDATAISQNDSRTWGEFNRRPMIVDAMGSSITALVGSYAGFKVVHSGVTEYFMAFVESTTMLSRGFRAFFYDSTYAPSKRVVLADNDVITLMKLGWVFVDSDGTTVDVTYTNPSYGTDTPNSPATGDYWFDTGNTLWKRYNGASFVSVNRTLVGMFISDSTNTVGARSIDFDARYRPDNAMMIYKYDSATLKTSTIFQKVNVAGHELNYGTFTPVFSMTNDLANTADMYDATEQASRTYYFYIKDTGEMIISDMEPYVRPDLYGYYHPHNPWRCIAQCDNDGSSNLDSATLLWRKYATMGFDEKCLVGTGCDFFGSAVPEGALAQDGSAVNRTQYAELFARIGTTHGVGDSSTTFNLPDSRRRVLMGNGGSSSPVISNTVGSTGGAETHTLASPEMPTHTHTDSGHTHALSNPSNIRNASSSATQFDSGTTHNAGPLAVAASPATASIQPTGGGGSHNNVQPSLVVTRAIWYR